LAKTSIEGGMTKAPIVTSGNAGFELDRPRCHHVRPMSDEESIIDDDDTTAIDAELLESIETVDGLPVLAEVRPIEVAGPASLPVVHAAAAAATGFVAGAATLALFRHRSARKLARARLRQPRGIDALPIVGSRRFLVDVHLIAKPGE